MINNAKTLKFTYLDHNSEMKIAEEIELFLTNLNKKYLKNELGYILKEIASNANKANMKRVHFNIKELNIMSEDEYEKGISSFREELSLNYHPLYTTSAKNYGYYVRLDFFTTKGYLVLSIVNNTTILPLEKERLLKKIQLTARFKSLDEALTDGLDTKESAGFGITLTIMMLRKLGLNENFFKLIENDKYTQIKIIIPLSLIDKEDSNKIADTIVKEIEEIPQFPQHIIELEKILSTPNSNFNSIFKIIKKDPSLIADLLKTANSAFYMLPHKVNSIEEAIRLIGFKGIRNLVMTYAAQNILMNRYNLKHIKEIMNHSFETAFYAFNLAKRLGLKDIADDAYLAGILHDFGKIIVNSLKPGILEEIKNICSNSNINRDLVENLTSGYNHSIIGAKLAKKWNFPEHLVQSIQFHHDPLGASDESLELVSIVYLANIYSYYKKNQYDYNKINYKVLERFKLTNREVFDNLIKN